MKTSDPEATLRKQNLPPATAAEDAKEVMGACRQAVLRQIATNSRQQIDVVGGDGCGEDCTRDGHQDM